jgi:hypothetical protein
MQIRQSILAVTAFLSVLTALPIYAQTSPASLITGPIDDAKRVALQGNVHPLAQPRYDQGPADGSVSTGRLLLLLNRPAEREAALQQYLKDAHALGSATYHRWITPVDFGTRFGPLDSDAQVVSGWLSAKGFQVARLSKGKTFIEFSGNLGQIGEAFHTQIRRYKVDGELHYANATDPQIPEALAGIVGGISALHDFRAKPQIQIAGAGRLDPATRKVIPEFTLTGPSGSFYAVAPQDFATQYDVDPLYAAGINGAGKTIGIINDSNIDLSLVDAYHSQFSPASKPVQVVIDGNDPGSNSDGIEAFLDVEVAGAVARGATVDLYIASFDTLDDPLILAALRAIEDNQADVLSVSFAGCEASLGKSGNQIVNALWQQAAALGQTVFVSAGDSGSAACDNHGFPAISALNGFAVNGLASTPWDVAVGGTDFYYSDYASGAPSAAAHWNAGNGANGGSLKTPLPEQMWNDEFGFNAAPIDFLDAGSGGVSTIYAKPAWQTGSGAPSDGYRDLPDVSLFAADGANLSGYVVCANPGDCTLDSSGQIPVFVVGGTSASTPAMAGIMALIDQKYGRQGQANFTLYPLARQAPAAFHDVTLGGNNVVCSQNSPDCVLGTTILAGLAGSQYTLSGYPATPGYDLASGLGSIDAKVMVDNWSSLTFLPTTALLQLSATAAQHGTPITLTADVMHSLGSEAPSGSVAIVTTSPLPSSQGQTFLPLGANGSASAAINSLPGGTYQILADYAGDGVYSGSMSPPVTLNVTAEASRTAISAVQMVSESGPQNALACFAQVGQSEVGAASGSTVSPGAVLWLTVQPQGAASSLTKATGSVSFSFDGQIAEAAPLNVEGIATWTTPATASAGVHSVSASYTGDASYKASQSSPFTYTVQKAKSVLYLGPGGVCGTGITCTAYAGDTFPVEVNLSAGGYGCLPLGGSVTVSLGSQTQTVALTQAGSQGPYANPVRTGVANFTNLQPGAYPLTATYTGDGNYQGASVSPGFDVAIIAPAGQRVATTTAISESNTILLENSGVTVFTVTVMGGNAAGGSSAAPTGTVIVYGNGVGVASITLAQSGPHSASGTSSTELSDYFSIGLNEVTAVYTGDSAYRESTSSPVPLSVVIPATPDFTITPVVPQFVVQERSSTAISVNLASALGFSGAVNLSCTTSASAIQCAISPGSVSLSGTSVVTLTVSAPSPIRGRPQTPAAAPAPQPSPASASYGVVVTGTANGIVHNAKLTVVVVPETGDSRRP